MAPLADRFLAPGSEPICLYGTTPPRADAPTEKIEKAATRLAARLRNAPVDGIVVYDVQDESSRTEEPRPFPYLPTLDSRFYSYLLQGITGKETITYKCVSSPRESAWEDWLTEAAQEYHVRFLSLVGRPTSRDTGGVARHTGMPLAQAVRQAAAHPAGFILGGVAIAERHHPENGRSESARLLQKAEDGCHFFISQAVYHPGPTLCLLTDYRRECEARGVTPRPLLLTFTPCGQEKTMAFLKWLGIAVPTETEHDILSAEAPLARSLAICQENLRTILDHPDAQALPLGLNVESVSIRKEEIDASVELFHSLREVMQTRRR